MTELIIINIFLVSEEWKSCPRSPSWAQAKVLNPCRGVFYYWRSACRGWSWGLMLCVWNFCGYFLLCQWKAVSHCTIKRKLEGFHAYMDMNVCSITVLIKHFTFVWLPCISPLQMMEQVLQGMEDDEFLNASSQKRFWLVCSWVVSQSQCFTGWSLVLIHPWLLLFQEQGYAGRMGAGRHWLLLHPLLSSWVISSSSSGLCFVSSPVVTQQI